MMPRRMRSWGPPPNVPDDAEAHALLGATAKAQKDNDTAREEFLTAIRLDPNNLSARIGLATLAIARKEICRKAVWRTPKRRSITSSR